MTLCKRCGVEFTGKYNCETKEHCHFCSRKLGLKNMEYGNGNIITDPTNSVQFIGIGIGLVIVTILILGFADGFDSYFEGKSNDKKIASIIKHQDLTNEFCSSLKVSLTHAR